MSKQHIIHLDNTCLTYGKVYRLYASTEVVSPLGTHLVYMYQLMVDHNEARQSTTVFRKRA